MTETAGVVTVEQATFDSELLPGELARPVDRPTRAPRVAETVAVAHRVLEDEGPGALTMRRLADEMGIRAPSLYKHFVNKAAVEVALIEDGLFEIGDVSHRALHESSDGDSVRRLLTIYHRHCLGRPNLYRLATSGHLRREGLTPGLEDWAGNPWFVVTGEPHLAQALWSFAHGIVILELDGRYPPGSDVERTLEAGAAAFQRSASLPAGPAPPTGPEVLLDAALTATARRR